MLQLFVVVVCDCAVELVDEYRFFCPILWQRARASPQVSMLWWSTHHFFFCKAGWGSLTYLLDNSPKRRNKEINSEAELLHIYLQDCIIKPLLFFCPYIKAQDEMALSGKWFPFCFVQIYSFLFSLFKWVNICGESRQYRIFAND